jgi:hypothetical protein
MKIALALATAILIVAPTPVSASTPRPVDSVFPRGLPIAPTEDSCFAYRCVWDAVHQDNGRGLSMILTRYHGEFIPTEITHRRAHRLQAAYCARKSVECRGYAD